MSSVTDTKRFTVATFSSNTSQKNCLCLGVLRFLYAFPFVSPACVVTLLIFDSTRIAELHETDIIYKRKAEGPGMGGILIIIFCEMKSVLLSYVLACVLIFPSSRLHSECIN